MIMNKSPGFNWKVKFSVCPPPTTFRLTWWSFFNQKLHHPPYFSVIFSSNVSPFLNHFVQHIADLLDIFLPSCNGISFCFNHYGSPMLKTSCSLGHILQLSLKKMVHLNDYLISFHSYSPSNINSLPRDFDFSLQDGWNWFNTEKQFAILFALCFNS